jgi:glycosyltransferase involved in cell wall biosynthesis
VRSASINSTEHNAAPRVLRGELRIAIDGRPALWPRTGIGTIASNVLERIQAADNANLYFAYFDNSATGVIQNRFQMECRRGGSRQRLVWANTWLPRQLRRDNIDVFVTFLDKELPLLPTRARVVSMVHDLIPLKFPDVVFRNAAHEFYYKTLIRASTQRSDLILTNSGFSRQEIVKELGVDESKICKITLGAEVPAMSDKSQIESVLRRYGLTRPYVIALGSTEPRKNNARVMQAMHLLQPEYPDLWLAIAGNNWRGLGFESDLIGDRVRQLGHVADEDLPALMQSAEMLVFPSLHEGFGFPVIEAMAQGVPVVTSNVTALPEVAGDAALFADPNDVASIAAKMKQILDSPALAGDLRARGRVRAGLFCWDATCAELVALCGSLVERHERRGNAVTQ